MVGYTVIRLSLIYLIRDQNIILLGHINISKCNKFHIYFAQFGLLNKITQAPYCPIILNEWYNTDVSNMILHFCHILWLLFHMSGSTGLKTSEAVGVSQNAERSLLEQNILWYDGRLRVLLCRFIICRSNWNWNRSRRHVCERGRRVSAARGQSCTGAVETSSLHPLTLRSAAPSVDLRL